MPCYILLRLLLAPSDSFVRNSLLHFKTTKQDNIRSLEAELQEVDHKLCEHAEEKREMIQTPEGQDLFHAALSLIEDRPWLARTLSSWDAEKMSTLHQQVESLVVEHDNPILMVGGFSNNSPPPDALISLAASQSRCHPAVPQECHQRCLCLGAILGINAIQTLRVNPSRTRLHPYSGYPTAIQGRLEAGAKRAGTLEVDAYFP